MPHMLLEAALLLIAADRAATLKRDREINAALASLGAKAPALTCDLSTEELLAQAHDPEAVLDEDPATAGRTWRALRRAVEADRAWRKLNGRTPR